MSTERCLLGVCLALLVAASPARAQENAPAADPAAEAERLFHEGVRLLEEARYESARAVLERAFELEHRASTGFNLASALHALGRSWEAHELLSRIDRGELGALPEGYAEPAAQLRQALLGSLGRVELRVTAPNAVEVYVDGQAAGRLVRESTILRVLEPGAHVVRAEAEGFAEWRRELSLEAGQIERISIALAGLDPAPHPASPPPPEGEGSNIDVWIGVAIGVALVLVAGAVALGVVLAEPGCDAVVGCIEF